MDTTKICFGCFNEFDGIGTCPHCGFNIATCKHPAIALPIGTILNGRYLTGRVLGVGGFGVTYLAMDLTLESTVAVKEYLPSGIAIRDADHYTMTVSSQEEQPKFDNGANKFLDEARILAKLRKIPNIVTVHDYFRENGTAYFVMEYIEGVDLMKYANSKGGRLSFEETSKLLLPIIRSLGEVHANNLLHRDISPDNILVTKYGTTQLLDFGAARQTIDGEKSKSIILKQGFAPEEQYRKHGNQGPWSDEYALAATMYLLITGVMPPDSIERVHEDTLASPISLGVSIPQYANDAIMKALSVKASERFPDMKSFAEALTGGNAAAASFAGSSFSAAPVQAAAPMAAQVPQSGSQVQVAPQVASPFAAAASAQQNAQVSQVASPFAAATSAQQSVQVLQSGSPQLPVSSEKVEKSGKKSIWKQPWIYVVAGVVLAAAIATPIAFFATRGTESTEKTKSTTKKTKVTTTTEESTEEPTTTTTEETTTEATTTETTTAPTTAATTDGGPVDLGNRTKYTMQDLTYEVTNEWYFTESDGNHFFLPVSSDMKTFLMAYSMQAMTPAQAAAYDFDQFMDEFNSTFGTSAQFENCEILACVNNKEQDLNYSDVVMTCVYDGLPKELDMRVMLDKTTGWAYCFMLYLDDGLDDATKSSYRGHYADTVASIRNRNEGLTSAEFKNVLEGKGFYVSEQEDDTSEECWMALSSNGYQITLIYYYRFANETNATDCYEASYEEMVQAQKDGQFSGKLEKYDGWFIGDGHFTEDSAFGEGDYYLKAVQDGTIIYVCVSTADEESRTLLDESLAALGQ